MSLGQLGQTGRSPRFSGRRQPSRGDTSRMMREYHVRICERLGVKFPGPTRHKRPSDAQSHTVETIPAGYSRTKLSPMAFGPQYSRLRAIAIKWLQCLAIFDFWRILPARVSSPIACKIIGLAYSKIGCRTEYCFLNFVSHKGIFGGPKGRIFGAVRAREAPLRTMGKQKMPVP